MGIGAVQANAAGTVLYVVTNTGIDAIGLDQPGSAAPETLPARPAGLASAAQIGARVADSTDTAAKGIAGAVFRETFDGGRNAPEPWRPANWDVTTLITDRDTRWHVRSLHAGHGSDCAPPPATHHVARDEDAVFLCRDHVMTALDVLGYAVIRLTPGQLLDFSGGEARLSFDLSTLRTSGNDWVDLWITPYEDQLQLPSLRGEPQGSGTPRRGLHLRIGNQSLPQRDGSTWQTRFEARLIRDFQVFELPPHTLSPLESLLAPSATRRDTFELRLSRTRMRFGLPAQDLWWIDTEVEDLGWTRGVVQLGHHVYDPSGPHPVGGCTFRGEPCTPTTWHWDTVELAPAVPFTLLPADRRFVDATTPAEVIFAAPAPEGAFLRFLAFGQQIEVSVDGGASWQPAQARSGRHDGRSAVAEDRFKSYWTPVPAGTQRVQLRGQDWLSLIVSAAGNTVEPWPWMVRSISLWAPPGS